MTHEEEAIMPEQSTMHGYLNWAKQRIDEMDATLASLEGKVSQLKADLKPKADQLIDDLRKQRQEFGAQVEAQTRAGEAAAQTTKSQLESRWSDFEALVKGYFETVGKQAEHQNATFQAVAAAQAKAWREVVDTFRNEAAKLATARRADLDAAIKQMNSDAAEAEARLQSLRQTGADSWATVSSALAESRKAFDRANQEAWEALKRAASPKA